MKSLQKIYTRWECITALNQLVTNNKVSLTWVQGNFGIDGIEAPDQLANKVSSSSYVQGHKYMTNEMPNILWMCSNLSKTL